MATAVPSSDRWFANAFRAIAPACFLILFFAPAAVDADVVQPLAKIRYEKSGREHDVVAQIVLQEPDRIKIRLFNEQITSYYVIYVEHTELLDVSYLTASEAKVIQKQRDEAVRVAKERRAVEKERRRKERAARLLEEKRKNKGSFADRGSRSRSSKKLGRRAKERARNKERSAVAEILQQLDDHLQPVADQLDRVHAQHEKNLVDVAGKAVTRESRSLRVRIHGMAEELEEIAKSLEYRFRQYETLERESKLSVRDAEERATNIARLLKRVETRLDRARADVLSHREALEGLPTAVIAEVEEEPEETAEVAEAVADTDLANPAPTPTSGGSLLDLGEHEVASDDRTAVQNGPAAQLASVAEAPDDPFPSAGDEVVTSGSEIADATEVSPARTTSEVVSEAAEDTASADAEAGSGRKSTIALACLGIAVVLGVVGYRSRRRTGFVGAPGAAHAE